ncbi:MAG: hypothetical protein NDI90_02410 [Nitrospira sp. BO4]|jgi:hypothetical protein|nr:hypothetical protein [Nitrospira sp. BO4]
MMTPVIKPFLYHDIDGILFGEYGPRKAHQLRPGISDWFHWTLARYQIVFLTSWQHHEVFNLLQDLYLPDVILHCRFLPWKTARPPLAFKWDAICRDQRQQPHPYFWIDDHEQEFPDQAERAQIYGGLPFVRVNPTGERELLDLMQRLNGRMTKMQPFLQPPHMVAMPR